MEDYETWLKAFGPEDFNLIVAIDTSKSLFSIFIPKAQELPLALV